MYGDLRAIQGERLGAVFGTGVIEKIHELGGAPLSCMASVSHRSCAATSDSRKPSTTRNPLERKLWTSSNVRCRNCGVGCDMSSLNSLPHTYDERVASE